MGLGPGSPELTTPAVSRALQEATDLVGYDTYLARVPEIARAAAAWLGQSGRAGPRPPRAELAAEGRRVALVSSGDPGVFAMAAAVFEAIEAGDPTWRALDVRSSPA